MIVRTWKGAVAAADGDAYLAYMRETGLLGYTQTPGNRGAWMLRRDLEDRCEYLMVSAWDSFEAIKGFAGEDYETAVFYPEDERFLIEREMTTTHYQVVEELRPQ